MSSDTPIDPNHPLSASPITMNRTRRISKSPMTIGTLAAIGVSLCTLVTGCDTQDADSPDEMRSAAMDDDYAVARHSPAVVFVSDDVMKATREWTSGDKDVGLADHLAARAGDLTFRSGSTAGCPAGQKCISSLADAADVIEANASNCSVLVNVPNYTQHEPLTAGNIVIEDRPESEVGPRPADYEPPPLEGSSSKSGWLEGPAVAFRAYVHARASQHHGYTSGPLGASTFAATVVTPVCPAHPEYVPRLKLETSYYGKMRGHTRTTTSVGGHRTELRVHGVAATSIVDDHQDDPTVLIRHSVQLTQSSESNFTRDLLLDLVEIANQYALDEFDPLEDANKSEIISKAKDATVTLLNGLLYEVGSATLDETRTLRATKRYGFDDSEILAQGRTYEIKQHSEYAVDIHAFASWFDTASAEADIANDFALVGVLSFENQDRTPIPHLTPGAFAIVGSQPGIDNAVVPERGFATLASTVREFMNFSNWPSCGDLRDQLEDNLTTLAGMQHKNNQGGNVFAFAVPAP